MKDSLSHESIAYEIPNEWLIETGANIYKPTMKAYSAILNDEFPTIIISFSDVFAPIRNPGVKWFVKERMVSILKSLVSDTPLPPIEVHKKVGEEKYRVKDGFHRFYASAALGFESLPVLVRPYFDINAL